MGSTFPQFDGSEYASDSSSLLSASQTTGTTEEESEEYDAHLSAVDQWHAQAQSWISGAGRTVVHTAPGQPDNGFGLKNTEFETAQDRRISVLMIDSLDRDTAVYPYPTSLRLKLPRIYKNVERIDICQIKFLNGIHALSAARGNTTFTWDTSGGTRETRVIPDGTYTIHQLLDALTAALVGTGISVSYLVPAGRIVISYSGSGTIGLPFASSTASTIIGPAWGLGWNLGFARTDLSGATSYTGIVVPRLFDDYLFLRLNESEHMNVVDRTGLENTAVSQRSTGQVNDYFGKLLLNSFGCYAQTFIESPKLFRPPLGKLERLNVDWLDRVGNPLTGTDAASCDWHMTVRITEIVEGPAAVSSLTLPNRQNTSS